MQGHFCDKDTRYKRYKTLVPFRYDDAPFPPVGLWCRDDDRDLSVDQTTYIYYYLLVCMYVCVCDISLEFFLRSNPESEN